MLRSGLAALLLIGCAGSAPPSSDGPDAAGGAPDASDPDPDPELSEQQLERLRELSPEHLPPAPEDPSNAWADDAAAAQLGQALFFETRFAGALLDGDNDGSPASLGMKGETGKVACASCHVPKSGFSDTRSLRQQISLAAGWGLRRAPSLLDVGQSKLLMWDGRRDSLYGQVFGPLESPVEMNSSRLFAARVVHEHYRAEYEAVFGDLPPLDDSERFPALAAADAGCARLDADNACLAAQRGAPGDAADFDALSAADRDAVTRVWVNVGKAIGAYERLLGCGQGRFDAWMQGDADALDRAEQRGAGLFVGKARCVTCHSGPFFSDERFHNVGLQPQVVATVFLDANDPGASVGVAHAQADPVNVGSAFSDGDDGRLDIDMSPALLGAFRTPRLRCVAERPSFMHTGHVGSLEDVVAFFDRGGDKFGYPGTSEIRPLQLSPRERADLVAFLRTLTGPGPDESLLTADGSRD